MEDNIPLEGDSDLSTGSAPQLSVLELRVLGAIMEKQLTTPNAYPMTLNSIITACNQKSSREPISNHQQGEVKRTLLELQDKKFVSQEYGSRAEKYRQQLIKHLELGKKQQALLCVMMLRGPQTVSELDTRTQRMCHFADREDLEHCIERLCDRSTPYAIRLGQQPGQRGERIGHLFSGVPTISAYSEPAAQPLVKKNDTVALLEMEVADLQKSVSTLENEAGQLRRQLESLYLLTGNELPSGDPDAKPEENQ